MSGHRDDGSSAENKAFHPNRNVSRGAYARLARDLSTGFPQMGEDDAPAGGIPRPAMHSCGGCGESTPASSSLCADCK